MDTNKIKNLASKYIPEEIDPIRIGVMCESVCESIRKYLDNNPKTKEKVQKLLNKEES